jgi:hypothetical protein
MSMATIAPTMAVLPWHRQLDWALVATRHTKAGHTKAYARAATPVTAAQVWKAWVRAARYWAAGR